MKKRIAFVLALTLCLWAGMALAQTYAAGGYYTLAYPDTLTLDDTAYADESDESHQWLFRLSNELFTVDASVETAEGYGPDFSLYAAEQADRDAYIDDALGYFEDNGWHPTYLAAVESAADHIPFYVFSMEDSDGPFLYAETIVSGYSVNFYAYYGNNAAPDEALMEQLTALLQTFVPTR